MSFPTEDNHLTLQQRNPKKRSRNARNTVPEILAGSSNIDRSSNPDDSLARQPRQKVDRTSRRGCMVGKGGPENATCTYRGVWQRCPGNWAAEIHGVPVTAVDVTGKRINGRLWLGNFKTPVEAARAYDESARGFLGSSAVLNFPADYCVSEPAGSSSCSSSSVVTKPEPVNSVQECGKKCQPYYSGCGCQNTVLAGVPNAGMWEAARAYDESARGFLGSSAVLNFPADCVSEPAGSSSCSSSLTVTKPEPVDSVQECGKKCQPDSSGNQTLQGCGYQQYPGFAGVPNADHLVYEKCNCVFCNGAECKVAEMNSEHCDTASCTEAYNTRPRDWNNRLAEPENDHVGLQERQIALPSPVASCDYDWDEGPFDSSVTRLLDLEEVKRILFEGL